MLLFPNRIISCSFWWHSKLRWYFKSTMRAVLQPGVNFINTKCRHLQCQTPAFSISNFIIQLLVFKCQKSSILNAKKWHLKCQILAFNFFEMDPWCRQTLCFKRSPKKKKKKKIWFLFDPSLLTERTLENPEH